MASAEGHTEKVTCISNGNSPIPLEHNNSLSLSTDLETDRIYFLNVEANLGFYL